MFRKKQIIRQVEKQMIQNNDKLERYYLNRQYKLIFSVLSITLCGTLLCIFKFTLPQQPRYTDDKDAVTEAKNLKNHQAQNNEIQRH